MGAAPVLIGPDELDREVGVLLEQAGEVVVVDDARRRTDPRRPTRGSMTSLARISALSAQPDTMRERLVVAEIGDEAGDQRLGVDVRGVPQAQPARPTAARRAPRRWSGPRRARGPRGCRRWCAPAGSARTTGPRDRAGSRGRRPRGSGSRARRTRPVRRRRRDSTASTVMIDVGLGVLALGGDPFAQLGVGPGQELDRDAGLLGERVEGLLEVVVAPRVDLDRVLVAAGTRRGHDGGGQERSDRGERSAPALVAFPNAEGKGVHGDLQGERHGLVRPRDRWRSLTVAGRTGNLPLDVKVA